MCMNAMEENITNKLMIKYILNSDVTNDNNINNPLDLENLDLNVDLNEIPSSENNQKMQSAEEINDHFTQNLNTIKDQKNDEEITKFEENNTIHLPLKGWQLNKLVEMSTYYGMSLEKMYNLLHDDFVSKNAFK